MGDTAPLTRDLLFFQGTFLTFRPEPYVKLTSSSPSGFYDAGDKVQFSFTVTNFATGEAPPKAFDVTLSISTDILDMNKTTNINCDKGNSSLDAASGTVLIKVPAIGPTEKAACTISSFVKARIAPSYVAKQSAKLEYFNSVTAGRPSNYASYVEYASAEIRIAPVDATILASQNAQQLMAGDQVNFTVSLKIPECETRFRVVMNLPVVQQDVIDRRRKRGALGLDGDVLAWPKLKRLVLKMDHSFFCLEEGFRFTCS